MTRRSGMKIIVWGLVFIAGYFALARIGSPLRVDAVTVSPVWLPHGLSLAAVLIFGVRFWPFVAIAVTAHSLSRGAPLSAAVGLAAAKVIEVLIARYLMCGPCQFTGALDNLRSVLALVFGGVVLASIPGAILSVTWTLALGLAPWSRFVELAGMWWLGDAMGALILAPIILTFVTERRWTFDRSTVTTLVLLGAGLLVASEIAFGNFLGPTPGVQFAYLLFPLIFWASLRFGVHGAALSAGLASLYATIGTWHGLGPFARDPAIEGLLLLATFTAVMVSTGIFLGAVISERRTVARALRDSQRRYLLASSAGRAGVWDWNLETDDIYVDPVLKNILGYEDHEIANTVEDWSRLVHEDDVGLVQSAAERHIAGQTPRFEVEHRMVHKDGSIRWLLARGEVQRDPSGQPRRLTGTDVDITPRKLAEQALEHGEQKIRQQLSELEHIYRTAPIGLALTDRNHRYVRINERLAALNGQSVEDHIGRSVRELLPEVADTTEPILRRVLDTGEPHVVEIETSTAAWCGTALVGHYPFYGLDGTVQGVGIIVQDITAQKKAEELQAGNTRALELVAQGAGLGDVMSVLAENVESQSGYGCLIRMITNDGSSLRLVAAPSLGRDRVGDLETVPLGEQGGSCGSCARRRRPVATEDVAEDPAWSMFRRECAAVELRSCWSIPILDANDEVLGTVALYRGTPGVPDDTATDVAKNAAYLARVAIEHTRAREALTKSESSLRESHDQIQNLLQRLIAGQEEERRRVSRELHDGLNQQLAALSFEIGRLRSEVADDAPSLSAQLYELQNRAALLIDDVRRISHELHPSMLEHLGLVAAVRAYCDEANRHDDVTVRFDPIHPPETIAPETALCLFRVVQEGVRNAAKHSGASAVQVTLRSSNGTLLLAIADNGTGLHLDENYNGGLGLVSMSERVKAIGGDLDILSNPREGTRLEVRVPIRP